MYPCLGLPDLANQPDQPRLMNKTDPEISRSTSALKEVSGLVVNMINTDFTQEKSKRFPRFRVPDRIIDPLRH